jgi:HD-GYP domain-containing protein (c-di-GMP phosphodiesterase class II)
MASEIRFGNEKAYSVMRNIVAQHHERGDGLGYPAGLTLSEISLEARIVAVADVYDALTSRRPYKEAWGEQRVIAELTAEVQRNRLDPDCVSALLRCSQQRLKIAHELADG